MDSHMPMRRILLASFNPKRDIIFKNIWIPSAETLYLTKKAAEGYELV
jgi:hypothetical protein